MGHCTAWRQDTGVERVRTYNAPSTREAADHKQPMRAIKVKVWGFAAIAIALLLAANAYLFHERWREDLGAELLGADIVLAASIAAISALLIRYRQAARRYRILLAADRALFRGTDTPGLLYDICAAAAGEGGFALVWIALQGEDGYLRPEALAGPALDYADGLSLSVDADYPDGRGPAGIALREGRSVVCNDFQADPLTVRWAERARRFGIRASAAFPLRRGGQCIGIIGLYSAERGHFDVSERTLIGQLAGDISLGLEHLRRERELQESAERLRGLSRRLMEVEESERRSINRELHDRVGQGLSALNLNLGLIRSALGRDALGAAVGDHLDTAEKLLCSAIADIRNLMGELQPPALDDYGLFAALQVYVDAFRRTTGLPISLHGEDPDPPLSPVVAIALFRIFQGALTNAAKHAVAAHVAVTLIAAGTRLTLTIADDGRGFDMARIRSSSSSWGLNIMRERAMAIGATLQIESVPGRGTRVILDYPG